ncbi:MAG: D-2-hydroxyacid dehydrogenase [Gammaproteobacteria bacterium]|nr:D-2-hydroxyacid dehydrogenase [Gammaproteobacteria bacterium]
MPAIRVVLATVTYERPQLDTLRQIFEPAEFIHCDRRDQACIAAALKRADIAVLAGDLDDRFLDAPYLKWVHCDHAGLERSARPEVFERGLLVTGSAGRSAPALAEHALFFMLALAYDFPGLYEAQRARRWRAPEHRPLRALHGSRLGIIGLGHTGRALAIRAKALGMDVMGYRRRNLPAPEGVDRRLCADTGDTLDPLLQTCDFIVLAARLTDRTIQMIGARELARMKPSACLINVARGALVDETALIEALHAGRIAGAGLDTFATEPLPRESQLWNAPRTLITPHLTPPLTDRTERSLAIIRDNADRYRRGEPLYNQLTPEDVYTGGRDEGVLPTRSHVLMRRLRGFLSSWR